MTCPRCAVLWPHLHVTDVLRLAGLMDPTWFTDPGRERGTHVHTACALLDRGDLDETSLDPVIVPYLDAYRRFLTESGTVWDLIEQEIEDQPLGYRGRLDRANRTSIADIKTGAPHWSVAVQIAAYRRCLAAPSLKHQYVLELRGDGTYRYSKTSDLSGLSDRDAERLWLSCLHVAQARTLHHEL